MAEDKVTNLYNAFVKNGYAMEPEAQFRENLKDPKKRKAAYDALVADGYNMEPFADFESNIGFGAPTPAPATTAPTPQQQAQPAATVAPTSVPASATAEEQEQASAQSQPEQPAWQPSEQEKIRMSYQMHTMLNDFKQKSKARIEQVQRMTEPLTPEGRKKLKAAKFQAQLAGTPTKVMGLTPPTPAPATEGAEGAAEGEAQQQPVQSGQSPVPYGVKYIDGKAVTQWLLPDGRLTTNYLEADQAEYGARTARLRHQFENRMKQNGLDPAKPEDVEMQAQFDAQAPAYSVVADLWREAEEKHKADKERNANKHWNSYASMGGGREMRVVTTSMNRHADNISHITRFDLETMMDNAWNRVGSQITANCYNRLRQQYPGASEEELQATASQMARSLSDNAVYQYAVQQNTPKSTLEYFGRTVADMNVVNSISKGLARSQAGTSGDLAAYEAAMGEYGKNHRVAQVAGTVAGMAVDPVTWVSGGVGSVAGKGAISLGGRYVASRAATSMSTQVGSRLFSSSLTGRIITGAAAGGGNFATYEMLKEGESQFLHGGHVNAETGEVEGYSAGAILKAGGHGLVLGSVTGTLSPMIGNVADKYAKATTSTAGKAGVRFGEVAVSTVAEGTVFSIPQWISGEGDAFDVWTDNMAMMLGFKAQHGIKSAPRMIASLRPFKPTNGRPLTQAERNHNRMDFEERLRRNLDASPGDLSFTADEREELRRTGYGELADLFSRDRVQEAQNPNINPAEGAIELRAERVEAETIHRSPEFDGYSAMEELMQDGRVSQAARAKAYYILTGRMLPMGSVTGYTKTTADDGRVTINSTTADGEIVTSRTFKNEQEAKQETDNIMRQAELNTIDVGERYKEAVADDMVLDAAIIEVSPGADPATIKKIYRAVKAGNKDVTESQVQLVEFLDDAIGRNKEIADKYRPEAIRAELMNSTGIDVDAVLRKMPGKRTEAEQAAVKSYLERLFPEEVRQHNAEPTPEQAEAQNRYEQGRLLYGRFEEGDPTVQADVDAIALRMQEAYQAVEDAFGAEAEYYMFHVNENPWALVNDPELTAEQQDAVLYYINAKAALDGVMDASNEVADRKRAEVEQSVGKRTHKDKDGKDDGMIISAETKMGKQVYIVMGDVVMFPDNKGVDRQNSSSQIWVLNPESGEYEPSAPEFIERVIETVSVQDELDTALSVIEQEQMNIFGENAVAPEEATESEAEPEYIDPFARSAEAEAPATTDTEEYDRGYEEGIEVSTSLSDEVLNQTITDLRGRDFLTEEWRGRLEAYEYEQQRRQMEAQNAPAETTGNNGTENIPQNGNIGAENIPAPEQQAETALSRIPLDEETQEPRFTAVDPETAWDGLVEAMEGEANALPIAQQMIEDANKRLEALGKKPPTPVKPKLAGKAGPMAMRAEQKRVDEANAKAQSEYQQALADAQAEAQAWSNILRVYTSRNAELRRQQEEERRQRDAIAHDEAVARFEEEQRIKAEKQAEQERIGVHAVNPKIRERWESAPKVEGNEDALTLPDGSTISGRYILTEAGAASPSHDVNNAYAPTEGFPIDENGQSVNDRDYQRDKDAQQKVEGMAGNYDNRALQDPVIVSKDGVVLSGNNRTMSGDLAARQGTDRAYNDYLAQFGHKKYGFTPEQVASMKNPRVVFVPDEALPYDATTFARFNAQEKKSQGKPEAAVKLGKIVPDNVFTSIVNDISRYDRLSDYYADEKAIAHALGALMQAGVINDMQMPEMRTGTALSAAGKELIENTLIGKVFQTSPDAVRQIISMPTLRQSIVMGLNEIANNRTLARNGYDISEELAKAVDLVTRAKAAMPDVYTDGMPVSPFGRMQGLFDDEFGDSRVADATALLLADILNSGKPSDLRKVLTSYNNEAAQASGGQLDMFSGSIPSKEEILTNVNEHFRNATPKEQQALVEAAIAERKRRAEAEQLGRDQESEQTPNDVERSAEPQQPVAGTREELTPEEQALAARVEITENDWEEGDSDKPTYKREIIIDGTHIVTQVDAPNEDGHYTGSYFEFDGKRFGDIAEIAQYIDGHPSAELKVDGGMQSEPTEAQKAAGNYKMEHRKVDGYNVSIENAKGSVRRGTGADGKSWETTMQNDYGYIRGTQGVDGDHIDVFLSDTPEEGDVFVVDQVNEDGSFDEHKVMYGFPTEQAARDAYLSNYEQGWTGLGAITHVSKEEFKKWIGSSKRKTKPFANYKSVKPKEDNSMVGRSLSEQEVTDLIAKMEANAEVAPAIELTPENWIAQFGEDGTVKTPIGIVKMGANQLLKLYSLKRTEYFGMIHPTLNSPDVILEEADPKEGSERDSKYLFIKTFVKSDGTRIVHFESVTVKKDGMEVSISSHEIKDKSLKNKMQNDIVLHLDEKLSPSSEMRLTETPSESEGPDLVPTSDNVSSDGKDNTLSADKQTDGAESSEPYTITPTTYTNKKGKTSDVHLVKFNRELTKEEKSALDTFVREPLAEGKKTSRGWYDRKQGGYMMRSEETARQLGEMLGNEEAVADAQPMTAEELREAVGASRTRNHKPKKSPINRVSLEDVMTDLSTKGETKLSDHAEPVKAEPEAQHEISDDEMQSLANELRELLGIGEDEGDADIKFRDPGELTPQERQRIQSAGIRLAMGLVERGTTSFPDYATKMVGLLGDKIRPWLKSFYEGARWTPGYEKYAFTPTEQVAVFDVQNFDKKQADPIAQAAMIVEERKASTASVQAQKELTETRNKNRRENDKQREADTAALAEKAEAVAGEAESIAETSADAGELNRASELIDQTLDEINDQLAVLGYYEAVEDDSKFHESYGYMLTAEKKAVADATKLAKQLVNDLGIDIKVTSATTLGRKRVKKGTAVRANIAPAGGDVIVNLPLNEGRILAIYIGLEPVAERGTRRRGDNLAVERILYRVENPNGSGMERWGYNMYAPVESTYADFLRRVKEITRDYLPKEKSVDELWHEWSDMAERGESPYTITPEVEAQLAEERKVDVTHNGYKVGDEVMWDRYGNGNWEKVKIEDFDTDGGPIFEAVKGVMSEKGDWSRVKPADGIFGEAKRVARATQEKKKSAPAKKKTAVKPEQPVAELFGGLFDEPINDEKKTDVQPRPGTAERERGHEPQSHESLGESQRNEVKGTDGRGMGGRDSVNPMSDGERGTGVPRKPKSKPVAKPLAESDRRNVRNNHAERGTDYAPKGEDARIKANIEAIELAKRLLDTGESATPEQMAVLRRFSGWGGLGKAFNESDNVPNPTAKRLRELLGEDGYNDAVMSRNSAYFTPAPVIDAMWNVAKAMGFTGGNVLEGSAGIGNILGLMPVDLSDRSSIHAVEIDRTTGGILSLLYPDAKVDIQGFEKTRISNNSIDLAITNVPFVTGLRVMDETGDKDLSKKFRDIHDFCIAKNIRKLREGGIGIFITSSGTMDNSKELRRWIINEGNADVVGAFRMHNKTFGGTGATSDIIVVRKRVNGKPSPNAIDVTDVAGVRVADYDTGERRKVKGQEIPVVNRLTMDYNKYFAEHPENMAGEMRFGFEEGDTFRPKSKALYPVRGKEQSEMLTEWAGRFADMEEEAAATPNVEDEVTRINEQLGEGVKEGSMVLNSQGELCMARMGEAVPLGLNKNKVKGHTKAECFNAYTAIKKALSNVLEYQSNHESDEGLAPLLKELNRAFDTFTRTYGNLHKNTAISFLRNDVDFSSILALETYSEKGDKRGNKVVKVGKTDIFSRRVIETEKEPQPTTIKDGILASLYKSGGIDVEYIGQALGKSTEDVKREIVESGLGFENPSTGAMEVSYQYLSGNVREKLHIAQENNDGGRYDANIKALENVMPMTIPAHLIEFALGSSWIEPKLYEDFVYEKTGIRVTLTNAGGTWFMKTPWNTFNEKNRAMAVVSKMCDKTIMGHELIESAITNKQITVSKTARHYDGTTETITDKVATAECGTKVDEIRAEFKDWAREHMQADPEMSARIERTYNEQFNNYVPMSIPDEFVPQHFGGQVSELHGRPFALRPHQGRAVVRGTTEPILLAHEVGTGKTYTLITTAMEMRRLGTARKPMIVVQNATVGQFVESAKEIYPNAKVLTIEEADRTAEGRRNFYAKIKYNDWDMIVVPQSVFERIPDSPEREMAYVKDIIDEKMKVLEAMREADSDGRSMIVRQAERELAEQEERLAELTEAMQGRKKKRDEKKEATTRQNAEVKALEMLDREVDDVENFDDMGIDAILVDESHEYKHLGFATAMQRGVKGVDPSFSKKSQGVFLKAQAVMERNNGRNVVFATGTPISNTAAEIWTFMRYLMPIDTMKSYGIYYFDDFVRNFGNIAQMVEFATNGKFKENNRFAGYVNLPELVRIWSSVADTVLTREAGGVSDKIPDMEGGKPQDIYLPQTRALRSVMKFVKAQLDRYDNMTGKEKKENSHIPLTMYGIAKAAAVDVRLVVPNAEDDPNSKTNATVRETLRSLKDSDKYKGTVAIFSDNYQNNQSGFNLYEDIRTKLIAEGVPADQIVVIKSGMTIKKKLDIFEKVNAGEIRVIMGSTFTLGTGVNIQERLHTLIHVDAPNRPMDYTQRNGRALRQGNLHKDMGIPVRIIRFGVEDSLDVTAYQRLKTKGAIADSIMNGSKMMQNSMENRVLEEEEDSFGDMTAQLSGSEYAILKNQAEREVRSLTAKQKGHDIDQIYVHNQLPKVEGFIKGAERRIELETKNLEIIGKHFPDGSIKKITIGKLTFDSVGAMEDFFKEQNAKMNEAAEAIREGADNYTSRLTVDVDGLQFEITTTVGRAVDKNGQGTLIFEPERNVTYSCEALGIKDEAVKGNRIKNVMQRIAEDIATGNSSRELLNRGQQQLAHYSEEYRLLQERNGREFPYKAQLAEAKERLAKYEEAMRKELEEKEAKYAEMDKSVDAASDIALTDEDSEDTPTNGDGNKYRLIEERGLLDFLDRQPLKLGYRYSQWANMGVLPPMTAKQNGEWRAPMVFSRWEQSEEGMRKENGKADLVQGNGRTTGDVAYNPYFHIRTSPLNDQFTAAYDRPELIVVEGYYPESEETSGYHADGAKDSVGLMDWHSGSVNGQLSEDTKVQTMLSRYFKPGRIVPWSEVADLIMERVGNQKITFPINAVPPMLRAELAKRGAKFGDISGSVAEADIPMLNELRDRVNAGEWDAGLEKAREYMDAYESSPEAKEARVANLSAISHTPVRIIRTQAEVDALPTRRERRAKGWWSAKDNEVVIVLPNNVNVADVDNTFVHEVAGHKGLRAFIGEERFDEFLGEVYNHASNPIRKVIDKKTDDMVNAEADRLRVRKAQARERAGEDVNSSYYADMAEARVEAEAKREEFRKEATEEYMSDLGGRIGSEGFEKMSRDELTLWGKIKAKVQSFLDKFLRGLKIAKSIRLNDKDLSYILYKSWKNLRDKQGKGGVFAEAEDVVMRRRTGYDADDVTRFRDPGLGLEETITKMKAEALQANTNNLQAKRDAMRAIGGNLNHLRQAMARQREYDITTVKSVADLARILMDANLLDDLSKYETKRILGAINNVVGKQDVSRYVQKVMDIMVDNQLRMGANTLGRLLSIRGSHVDARGIEVQGELDPDGQRIAQVVRKATSLPKDNIDNRIAEAINRMSSTDQAIADDATIEYAGLQIARQYVEDITESKAEEKALRDSVKQAKEDKDAGQMTEDAYRQYVASTEDAIRQNKIERAEAFHSLVEQVGGVLNESVERAKAWREAEKQRVEEIHHNANSDMEGRPTDEHHKDDRTQKLANNSGVRFLLAPLATFDQMLRMFGKKNTRGEGYLWNRYMRGWVSATEKEYTGYRDALKVLDAKVSEIYGKDMKWGDLFSIDRKLPKASVRFFDGGVMKDHELTQGNLLYIYMVDKMSDGRMKLRRMGITEENIEDIKNFLDPKFIQLADWMQEEFLVDKRNEYNEVHKRMFGASMAAIENYFPLKILANARLENVDVADDTTDTALPATSTGSIIKRRRNNLALDVTGANAFSVILDHLQQMERWAAFAEFNRDLNTLLSYKRFRNQVMNMSSVYGGGKTLWNNFRNVCSMAAGAYRPPIAALDKSAVNIAKGVTAAKVSFRVFTALKQFLSMPAYISDSNPMYLAANIANPIGAWRWSMKNLPLFEKRWSSRMAGDPRLLKSDMDWKMWRSRIVEIASRVGMSPNAFVDALTVAIGSHSMYQTKLAKYKRQGYDHDVAEARAKQDATILFNQTQQSSEGAFLSTMQVDRSWLSVLFTVFRNSSMSYTRQLYDSIRNLGHRFTPGYKGLSEEFMAKQMRRDGIDPDKADRNAKQEYRRGIIRDLVRVGVFGYVLQLAWNLGAYLPYLILGEDDEEKDKMWQDVWNHTMFGSIEGLTGGDVISAAGNMWVSGEGNPQYLTKDMPLASDVLSILKKMDKDQVSAMNDVVNLLVQSTVGVNPQSLTDAVVAVMDYCGDDAETSRECALLMARVLNCPQSQLDKIYFDELDASGEEASQMTPSEIAERYARYKVRRGAPLTGWAYGNEQREKLMDKYRDRSNTLAKERLTRETDKQASQNMAQWLEEFEATKDRVKEIRKVKSRDEDRYDELLNELEITPEYDRYEIIKGYKRDVDALTKEWLNATTPAQRDSCAQAIIRLKSDMVRELINTQQ
ncbi:helicase-related protein [Muribaculum intestinale]|uniref:helicase-related protein n=1 Tax=Muribaculum intestinale TaxID=1796646 RepID=UPI0025AA2950|nr:helicase-related protein [Muribaculum intestinale]